MSAFVKLVLSYVCLLISKLPSAPGARLQVVVLGQAGKVLRLQTTVAASLQTLTHCVVLKGYGRGAFGWSWPWCDLMHD